MGKLKKGWLLMRLFAKRYPVLAIVLGITMMTLSVIVGNVLRGHHLDVMLIIASLVGIQLSLFGAVYL